MAPRGGHGAREKGLPRPRLNSIRRGGAPTARSWRLRPNPGEEAPRVDPDGHHAWIPSSGGALRQRRGVPCLLTCRFLAELTKQVFSDLSASKYQLAEYRISIYGRKQSEWDQLASWIVNNELHNENVVWLVQGGDRKDVFFYQADDQHFIPRSLLIDLEPRVINGIQNSSTRTFTTMRTYLLLSTVVVPGTTGPVGIIRVIKVVDDIMDMVDREANGSDSLEGFVFHDYKPILVFP